MPDPHPADITLPPTQPIDMTALIREALAHHPQADESR